MLPHSQAFAPSLDDRLEPRRSLSLWAQVSTGRHGTRTVQLLNLSTDGLLIAADALHLAPGEVLTLHLPDGGAAEAEAVWSSGDYTGLNLRQPLSNGQVARLLLRAEPRRIEEDGARLRRLNQRGWTTLRPQRSFAVPMLLAGMFWVAAGFVALG